MKKRLRKGDQKKTKGQNGGNFPTQRNFEWEKDKNFVETYSDVFENIAICLSKTKRRNGGNFPTQWNFERENDKNFGVTYSNVFENVAICLSKTSLFVSPKFFGKYGLSSLKTIVTFSKNVAINKKYATKTVLFAAF